MADASPTQTPAVTPVRRPEELPLSRELLVRIHELMVKARALEERLIQMYKQGQGFFWIGGPGEEAFNVPLGLLVRKGEGLDHDYLHLHYRQSAALVAMGEDPINPLRQMRSAATDPYSRGRNFVGHYCIKRWNVAPITSPVEIQYAIAPGTALAQKRHGGQGITIVGGGDAGTAEGDFASCLVWSSRPGKELPLLILVTNNAWGISTPASEVQGCARLSDRGKAFGMRTQTIDGNDPIASYRALEQAMAYVRSERRPFLLEAMVSRLYGHSSASGANWVPGEPDCIPAFEARLEKLGVLGRAEMEGVRKRWNEELAELARRVRAEPSPSPDSIWEHVYAEP